MAAVDENDDDNHKDFGSLWNTQRTGEDPRDGLGNDERIL